MKIKKFYILIIVINVALWFVPTLRAVGEQDTASVYRTKPVVVTTDKPKSKLPLVGNTYKIFRKEEIEESGKLQINEVIKYSPGISINDYGGMGAMKTISSRGTTSSQTSILLDGIAINSVQNGSFDLGLIPLGFIEQLEVVRGGNSSAFGSSAIGGAVNISTVLPDEPQAKLVLKYGSFDDKQAIASGAVKIGNTNIFGSIEHSSSLGNYPFDFTQFGERQTYKRKNADYELYSLSFSIQSKFPNLSNKTLAIATSSQRGAPGAVLQNRIENTKANLESKEIYIINRLNKTFSEKSIGDFSIFAKYSDNFFEDPDLPLYDEEEMFGERNRFINRTISAIFGFTETYEIFSTRLESSSSFSDLFGSGKFLDPSQNGYVWRFTQSLMASMDYKFGGNDSKNELTGAIRADYYSDGGLAISPMTSLHLVVDFLPFESNALLSYNYRMPSFNEMYYLNYGTTDLKPERSLNFNLNLSKKILEHLTFNLTGYLISTSDQIVYVAKTPISGSAQNIDEVLNRGIELSLDYERPYSIFRSLTLNYTFQKSTNETSGVLKGKEIPYIPKEIISAIVQFDFKYVRLEGNGYYSSFRYVQPDNSSSVFLPSYLTIDAGIVVPLKKIQPNLQIRMDAKNITDKRYSIVSNYPMQGRSIMISLLSSIGNK